MDNYHKFDIHLAASIGVVGSIIFECLKSKGRYKVQLDELLSLLSYMNKDEILNNIVKLEDSGLVSFDRSKETLSVSRANRNVKLRNAVAKEGISISKDWRPSEDTLEIIKRSGINSLFIEEQLPEFVIYWLEQPKILVSYNSKFIEHIRMKWAQYNAEVNTKKDPHPIPDDWTPSDDCRDILQMTGIENSFIHDHLPEFIMYWRDDGRAFRSWDVKFLEYTKNKWNFLNKESKSSEKENFDFYIPSEPEKTKQKREKNIVKNLRDKYKI